MSTDARRSVRVRRMRWWDVPGLLETERASFGADAWSEAAFWSELAGWPESRRYVVAEEPDGHLAGYAGLSTVVDEATVATVAVEPSRRGTGIGRLLVEDLLAEAARRDVTTVWLEVRHDNVAALALYEAYGFVRAGLRRGYYDAGRVDAVVMRRRSRRAPHREGEA